MKQMRLEGSDLVDAGTRTLDRVISFSSRIDVRAQVLLGIDVGALLTLALNVPDVSRWRLYSTMPAALAVILFAVSIFKLYRCVFPQLEGGTNSLLYFGEIRKLREADFIDRFRDQTIDAYTKDILAQTWRNSDIVFRKFESLKQSMELMAVAIIPWLVALAMFVIENHKLAVK